MSPDNNREKEILQLAEQDSPNLVVEFFSFLKHNKRWWLAPIVIVLLLLSLFVVLTGSVAGPFIYTFI